ncbi:MAG TPA: hypothetical protein VLA04_01400 [Verrucomicrobiae bacterium]|nr:hypothetical protein [Verrucomicrobiae bacterium]
MKCGSRALFVIALLMTGCQSSQSPTTVTVATPPAYVDFVATLTKETGGWTVGKREKKDFLPLVVKHVSGKSWDATFNGLTLSERNQDRFSFPVGAKVVFKERSPVTFPVTNRGFKAELADFLEVRRL